jgi:hypothetical protein
LKCLVLAFSLCLACASLWPLAASAGRNLDSYCSPTGDYCMSVVGPKAKPSFVLRTFSFSGQYKLCVKQAGYERQCGWWKLKSVPHGIHASRVDVAGHYFLVGPGDFALAAFHGNQQIGRALHFTRG